MSCISRHMPEEKANRKGTPERTPTRVPARSKKGVNSEGFEKREGEDGDLEAQVVRAERVVRVAANESPESMREVVLSNA